MKSPDILINLLSDFSKNNVLHCCWKNNFKLDDVMAGKRDLDLYIPLRHKRQAELILFSNDFREFVNPVAKFPYIHHYFTPLPNGSFLHLHVYNKLLTGESHLKDYWLQVEELVESRRVVNENGVYVLDSQTQRLVYLLRYYLKNSSIIGCFLYRREIVDYNAEYLPLEGVRCRTDDWELLGVGSCEIFDIDVTRLGFFDSWIKGVAVRRALSSCRRYSVFQSVIKRNISIINRLLNKLFYRKQKSLTDGGRFIAITGLDGTGKSTLINSLYDSFSANFSTCKVHIGKPTPSFITIPFRIALFGYKILQPMVQKKSLPSKNKSTIGKTSFVESVRYLVLAYERSIIAKRAYRSSCAGFIVLSDRYPSTSFGCMDSPRISSESESSLTRWFALVERRLYASMPKPDLLIILTVPVENSIVRNNERVKKDKETEEEIRERYLLNRNLSYRCLNLIEIENTMKLSVAKPFVLNTIWRIVM